MTYKEIDEMIRTVDKNGDGKINYSEFRVMMGAPPLLIPATTLSKFARSAIIITIIIIIDNHHQYLQVSHGPHTADILGSVRARGPSHSDGEILDV